MRSLRLVVMVLGAVLAARGAGAQGTKADYERAQGLRERYQYLTTAVADAPVWIGKTTRFYYRVTIKGGHEFVMVDATTQQKQPAFDHTKLAAALTKVSGTAKPYIPTRLPFNVFTFSEDEKSIDLSIERARWICALADYTCKPQDSNFRPAFGGRRPGLGAASLAPEAAPRPTDAKVSPDGAWEAIAENYNVIIRPAKGGASGGGSGRASRIVLSTDGSEGNYYDMRSIAWSPDSRKIAIHRVRPGYRRLVHYVESSPEDQLQPKHSTLLYAKPGDVVDLEQPVIFDVASKTQIAVVNDLFPNPFTLSDPVWRKDSRTLTFEYNQRGHQVYRVIEVDAATGTPRAMISEEAKTFFYYNLANTTRSSGKRFRHDVAEGKEVIWMSERDGWNHLYLYDGASGKVTRQITKGEWAVRHVEKVDDDKRQIWFSAGGMTPGQDPYFLHYYRINFDGTGLTPLTTANADHMVKFSADTQYYVDTYSRVDLADVMELRKASDGSLVKELERGDVTELKAAGWKPPEPFVAKGRDGKTDIYGVIVRPTNFDPSKKYAVLESIYAGPQGSFVPKNFSAYSGLQAQADIGFIVVQIDGMGTSNRSKAFHDYAFKDLKDAGFPDRILWHKAVAAKYPFYDITRVGLYGGSAGGQNALGGLLFHPEFYRAAVAYAGCHDNRMDKIWWNEQWMSWPIGPQYAASSNVDNAYRLQGAVLLVVGELDTNVDPSSTMQVVNALVKANKTFDLLVIPGAEHSAGRSDGLAQYGERKRFDFFVQHLLGKVPPAWNNAAPAASAAPTAAPQP
jgi:dipeptidyl aminopeptidase/acylaminoacyl peptidase